MEKRQSPLLFLKGYVRKMPLFTNLDKGGKVGFNSLNFNKEYLVNPKGWPGRS
jgi:hypothetical protein